MDGAGLLDLPYPPLAFRVIKGDDKIGGGSGAQPPDDDPPGGEEIGKGDHGKVVHERRAEHRGGRLYGRDPGNDDNLGAIL